MNAAIREASRDDADLEAIVALVNEVTPDDPSSIEEIRWADATYPGTARFLATVDGRPVGVATVGRIYMQPPEFDALWATIAVLPSARRLGLGASLLTAVSDRARVAAKGWLHVPASDARPEGIEFLARRGFTEYERAKLVRLELADLAAPPVDMPAGVRLTTLAVEPALVEGVHAVALEAFPDIPGGDQPDTVGDLAEFRARDVDRAAIPPDAFFVALDAATGRVIGYASLMLLPGSRTVAWHDMTAVARSWRGRGLASALKRATIGWALGNGLTALETGNDVANGPMRAINAKLGFQPLPDLVLMRGRPMGGIMEP